MSLLNAALFGKEVANQIEEMGLLAEQIADRWASGWPEQTKKLQDEDRLLSSLRDQVKLEREALAQASNQTHLAQHEIMRMRGIAPNPPA